MISSSASNASKPVVLAGNDLNVSEVVPAARPPVNLVELLRHRAREEPHELAYTFLADGHLEAEQLTFADLDLRARCVAWELRRRDVCGRRVLVVFTPGVDVVVAFFGCLYAGAVAVPCPPPEGSQIKRAQARLNSITNDCHATIVLTEGRIRDALASATPDLRTEWIDLSAIAVAEKGTNGSHRKSGHKARPIFNTRPGRRANPKA